MRRFLCAIVAIVLTITCLFTFVGCGKKDGEYSAKYVEIAPTEQAINPVLDEINSKLKNLNDYNNYYVTYNYNSTDEDGKATKYKLDMKVDGDADFNKVFAVLNMETFIERDNIDHCFRVCIYRKSGEGQTFNDYAFGCIKASPDIFNGGFSQDGGNILGGSNFEAMVSQLDDSSLDLNDSIFELINPKNGENKYMKALMKYLTMKYEETGIFQLNEVYINHLTHPVTERLDHSTNVGAFIQELGHLRYVAKKTYKAYKSDNGFYKLEWEAGAKYYLKINEDGTYKFKFVNDVTTQELVPIDEELPSPSYRDTYYGEPPKKDPNKQ